MNRLALCMSLLALTALAAGENKALFDNLPEGWRLTKTQPVSAELTAGVARRLGVDLSSLENAWLAGPDRQQLRVNILTCANDADAARLLTAMRKLRELPNACLPADGNRVLEFMSADVRTVLRAPWVLGLKPKQATYRVGLDVALVDRCDYMQTNDLFSLMLARAADPDNADLRGKIAAVVKTLTFGNSVQLRMLSPGGAANWTFRPEARAGAAAAAGGDAAVYTFANPLEVEGIRYVHAEATITSRAFEPTPTQRKADEALLSATEFWPVKDERIVLLAKKITAGAKTDREKTQALLDYLTPGRNIRYAGKTGSRYGTQKVLQQGFGHCWDFSDVFVTLSRAAGVPARQVGGWLRERSGHVWAEVLLDGEGWLQVDPTAGMECSSDYVAFFTSEDGQMPIVLLSMPAVQVVKP